MQCFSKIIQVLKNNTGFQVIPVISFGLLCNLQKMIIYLYKTVWDNGDTVTLCNTFNGRFIRTVISMSLVLTPVSILWTKIVHVSVIQRNFVLFILHVLSVRYTVRQRPRKSLTQTYVNEGSLVCNGCWSTVKVGVETPPTWFRCIRYNGWGGGAGE